MPAIPFSARPAEVSDERPEKSGPYVVPGLVHTRMRGRRPDPFGVVRAREAVTEVVPQLSKRTFAFINSVQLRAFERTPSIGVHFRSATPRP
ncbi:Hypothetical protein CINCED_3A002297 [Cinara cedri]|uniref:Uncharacterized protein n=1 Tax=Cinara cedri TaxID=506608 RepID=A0A5E4NIW0_9HEMI|nr:Hypothetical protein CINCED_3A002297 [Cinara cedri]